IATVLGRFPLRSAGVVLDVLLILLLVVLMSLASLYLRIRSTLLVAALLAGGYLAAAQVAFNGGHVLPIVAPLVGLAVALMLALALEYRRVSSEQHRLRRLFAEMEPAVVSGVLDASPGARSSL